MTETTVVRVTVQPESGGFAAFSDDVFGLHLWAATIDELRDCIAEGIKLLYRLNRKIDVEVALASALDFGRPTLRVNSPSDFLIARTAG